MARTFARNPADVAAGIDASKQPMTRAGQTTGGTNTRTTAPSQPAPSQPAPNQTSAETGQPVFAPPPAPPEVQPEVQPPPPDPFDPANPLGVIPYTPIESPQFDVGIPETQSFLSKFNQILEDAKDPNFEYSDAVFGGGIVTAGSRTAMKGVLTGYKAAVSAVKRFILKDSDEIAKAAANSEFAKKIGADAWKKSFGTKTVDFIKSQVTRVVGQGKYGYIKAIILLGVVAGVIDQAVHLGANVEDTNEDRINGFRFAQAAFERDENWEAALEMGKMAEAAEEAIYDNRSWLDYFNVFKSGEGAIKDNLEIIRTRQEIIEKKIAEREANPDAPSEFTQDRLDTGEAVREQELQFREEDTAFFDAVRKENRETELSQMKQDRATRLAERDEDRVRELQEREEDSAYFDAIADKKLAQELSLADEKNKKFLETMATFQAAKSARDQADQRFFVNLQAKQRKMATQERVQERAVVALFWKQYNAEQSALREEENFQSWLKKQKSKLGFGLL